eukprot:9142463-Pyramimonas_sp.AAC.2
MVHKNGGTPPKSFGEFAKLMGKVGPPPKALPAPNEGEIPPPLRDAWARLSNVTGPAVPTLGTPPHHPLS